MQITIMINKSALASVVRFRDARRRAVCRMHARARGKFML